MERIVTTQESRIRCFTFIQQLKAIGLSKADASKAFNIPRSTLNKFWYRV